MRFDWSVALVLGLALAPVACSSSSDGGGGAGSGGTSSAGTGGAGGATAGAAGSGGQCAATNPRVGWVATLAQHEAGVSGTATLIDDCTIKLEHFSYDGSGIAVYLYAGKGGDYSNGFALSGNLLGQTFSDATVTLTLPAGKSLDDVDGIAVWCADVSVSFGDGMFAAP